MIKDEVIFLKKTTALLCALCIASSSTVFAADISDWAKSDYETISQSGILTKDIVSNDLKKPITREELAAMAVNLYTNISTKKIKEKTNPFSDTDNDYVIKAFSAGIVSGKSESIFDPEGNVTRQELAKMILNTLAAAKLAPSTEDDDIYDALSQFEDAGEIASWAEEALFVALDNGIINGITETQLSPRGTATREQAICMISRAYKKFAESGKSYDSPNLLTNTINSSGDMDFTWDKISNAKKYFVILKDENSEVTEAFETKSPQATIYSVDYATGEYSITLGAEFASGVQTFTEPMDFSFSSPIVITAPTVSANLTTAEKEARVFPGGVAFTSADEAAQNMVSVTVPVWIIGSNGGKYSKNATLEVNSALADDVVNIFTEIFNSPEQFPIKAVSGYCWRNTAGGKVSQHSYGTCIDINPNENYYVSPAGVAITGNYWKPYEDPYSIPEDGIVVQTFAKYGWKWGGNAWGAQYNKDYMHFTYLGK